MRACMLQRSCILVCFLPVTSELQITLLTHLNIHAVLIHFLCNAVYTRRLVFTKMMLAVYILMLFVYNRKLACVCLMPIFALLLAMPTLTIS